MWVCCGSTAASCRGIQADRYKPACKTALPKQSSPCIEGRAEAYRSNRSSGHRAGKPALRQVTAAPCVSSGYAKYTSVPFKQKDHPEGGPSSADGNADEASRTW